MHNLCLQASLVLLLTSSCADQSLARQGVVSAPPSASCIPEAAGALVARASDVKTQPRSHTVVASNLILVEAKYVEGPCADKITHFIAGNAVLISGKIFVIRDDGSVKLYPRQGLREQRKLIVERIPSLKGYRLVTNEQVRLWLTPGGQRESYIGLFKGKSDYVIARFDLLDSKLLRQAEILIRSQSPITSVDYLPAPDTPDGRIGFVLRAGKNKAWLYGYDWPHGITGRQP